MKRLYLKKESDGGIEEVFSKDVSVVIQGMPSSETLVYIKKVRNLFPDAELILSTWIGVEKNFAAGLIDKLVLNEDPGAVPWLFCKEKVTYNNVNRQMVSTVSGIKASTRPFVIKLRTDFVLENRDVLKYWGRYVRRNERYSLFKKRIVVPSISTSLYSAVTLIPKPFHVSDFFAFGLREDLLLFYGSTPLATEEELGGWQYKFPQCVPDARFRGRYAPEQMFFLYAAKTKFPEIQFDDWSDLREEVILLSNHLLMNNFIFVNPGQIGLRSKKHQRSLDLADQRGIRGLLYNEIFDRRYTDIFVDRWNLYKNSADLSFLKAIEFDGRKKDSRAKFLSHKKFFVHQLKDIAKIFNLILEPFLILFYWIKIKLGR